jgi:hypothetical protein
VVSRPACAGRSGIVAGQKSSSGNCVFFLGGGGSLRLLGRRVQEEVYTSTPFLLLGRRVQVEIYSFYPFSVVRQKGPCAAFYLPPLSLIRLSSGDWLSGIVIGEGASPLLACSVALGVGICIIRLPNSEGVSHPI